MYIRFIICRPGVRPAQGILCGDYDSDEPRPQWLEGLIDEHRAWFNEHLPVPRYFTTRIPPRNIYRGLSWFRPEAHKFIARARELACLLEKPAPSLRSSKRVVRDKSFIATTSRLWRGPARRHRTLHESNTPCYCTP